MLLTKPLYSSYNAVFHNYKVTFLLIKYVYNSHCQASNQRNVTHCGASLYELL